MGESECCFRGDRGRRPSIQETSVAEGRVWAGYFIVLTKFLMFKSVIMHLVNFLL